MLPPPSPIKHPRTYNLWKRFYDMDLHERAGRSNPLGAMAVDGGANFSVFPGNPTGVELVFFDSGMNLSQEGRWLNFERYWHGCGKDRGKYGGD